MSVSVPVPAKKPIDPVVVDDAIIVDDPAMKNMVNYLKQAKYVEAIDWIQKKAAEDEQVVRVPRVFNFYPTDGAVAFYEVLRKKYGWIEQLPERTFWGKKPPAMVTVETPQGRFEVPWGDVAVPGIEGKFTIHSKQEDGMWKFGILCEVKQKHRQPARELMDLVAERLLTHSIYRGQAISLKWEEEEPTMFTNGNAGFALPKFIEPSGFMPNDLILPIEIYEEVDATIFSLIRNSEEARRMGIPTKRLVLLAGPYGVGKTLTAAIVAELCRKVGRTFVNLADVAHLADATRFLVPYSPACIFAEDVDAVDDEDTMDLIANTIDGIDTKNLDIIFVLTTNHPEEIPDKFLRPGRSDMVIRFTHPDAEACARLIMRYGGATLQCSFEEAELVGVEMARAQMIPASVRECVERSKLFALRRGETFINAADLHRAALSVSKQLDLLKKQKVSDIPDHMEEVGRMIRPKNGVYAAQN